MGSERAKFGTPEINLGLIPGGGGTQRLPRLVGYGRAMEMILSGEMVDAHSALQMGLLNHLYEVDELEQKTLELAKIIASKSPHTLKIAKACVRAALEKPMHQGLEEEASAFAGLFDSEDKEIGVKAFMERTQAEWVGK
jgi:enoyl-CoA hydratase